MFIRGNRPRFREAHLAQEFHDMQLLSLHLEQENSLVASPVSPSTGEDTRLGELEKDL